ncbi:MAG: Flagellin protein FlaB, partial [Bacteriovoracaceae bacterium]|nr:Flagellin protein FlaB [Bacteriovoracaceae bacterium]
DRGFLNSEFQQLLSEFDRVATQSNFNGTTLLDGSFGTKSLQVGAQKGQTIDLNLTSTKATDVFQSSFVDPGGTLVGAGTYSQVKTFSPGGALVDINHDGKLDVISNDASTIIKIGNGDGTFTSGTLLDHHINTFGSTTGDLNSDGSVDFAVSTNDGIHVWTGNGDGTFQNTSIISSPNANALQFADVNGDGKLDLVWESNDGLLNTALGNGDGTFKARTTISSPVASGTIATAEINRDGKLDVVVGSGQDSTALFLGNGNGTFKSGTIIQGLASSIVAKDINNDGKVDLVSTSNFGFSMDVLLGNGDGTFQSAPSVAFGSGVFANGVSMADLNGDGKLDAVVGTSNGVQILFGNGDGTFAAAGTLNNGNVGYVGIFDINGDGVLDIVGADGSAGTFNINFADTQGGPKTVPLGVPDMNISTQARSQNVLQLLDRGLTTLNSARSTIGATQSRLGFADSVNETSIENISFAKSQILDVDYASEMAEFTRLQVLQQAGVAVLTQANSSTQLTLKLLQNL